VLVISIAPSGDVSNVRVDASDLSRKFGTHIAQVVSGWKFAPSMRGGEPLASELRLRFPVKIR
jgi:outer membrane biosynthesis protein TonB